ncbi:MAG: efflux RND transporter permease subunit, partial [Planctomycetota bacterium]
EAIFRRRQEGLPGLRAAIEGATDVGGAVLASTLTTVAVFFPIVFVEGMAGQVFRDQALTVVFSLLASLIVALTLIPMLAARFGGGGPGAGAGRAARLPYWRFRWRQRVRAYWKGSGGTPRPRKQQVLIVIMLPAAVAYLLLALIVELVGALLYTLYLAFATAIRAVGRGLGGGAGLLTRAPLRLFQAAYERVEAIYLRLIDRALRRRGVVFAIVFITLAGALLCSRMLGSELIPGVARGEFVLHLSAPVGSPLASTEARVREIERRLQGIPGIASLATTVGVDPEDVESSGEGEHSARVHVRLERRREKMADLETRVLSDLHSIVVEFPDLDSKVTRPALFSFRTPFEVEIRGHKLAALRRISDEVRQLLEGLPDALTDVRSSVARGSPEYHLYPDREKMSRYGVTSEQIAGALRRKNMGEVATRYRRDDRRLDVRVQLEEQDRASIGRLLSLVVAPRDDGGGWTLEDLVERWEVREGPAEIRRVGRQRAAVISADLAGLDLGRVAESIEERILSEIRLPPDVSIEVTGQKKEMERSQGSLIEALLLAVFLVYVVMASQFESLLQPFIILFTIPLAAVGVMGTLWATATPLSMMAFIGMIMLAGIVVNNAIVLLDQINRLRREGYRPREAIIEGGRRRLRPILMTTLTTVLAMVPLTGVLAQVPHDPSLDFILGTGQGAEIRAPLALTVIGGLLSSTLLTLVVIPVVTSLVLRERGRGDEDGERGGA